MFQIILGAAAMAVIFLLINYSKKQGLTLPWWGWALTVLGVLFAVFTVEVVATLIFENAPQAALVMGVGLGLIAAIWGTLIARFVFVKR